MSANGKTTRFFSWPLTKQDLKSNLALALVILLIMLMMSTVINYAMSIMQTESSGEDTTEAQEQLFTHLSALAVYDAMAGADLSLDDFESTSDHKPYEQAFGLVGEQIDADVSVAGFQSAIDELEASEVGIDTYVKQFEYAYALSQSKGVFTGDELDAEDMMTTMLEAMGVSTDLVDSMGSMDTASLLNRMYFTVIGLLPILLLIVVMANSLIADKVDKGSMVYVLSTPTKRSAVTITQAAFLIVVPLVMIAIVCASRIASSFVFYDEVCVERIVMLYVGMYILVEAIAAICYLASCWFNQSKRSLAVGGGLAVWFFLASLLGTFGSENLVDMGVGVEALGVFNNLTLVGLFDIDAIGTIGTGAVDDTFIWKLAVLAVIAVVCYVVGAIRFKKKDLPL